MSAIPSAVATIQKRCFYCHEAAKKKGHLKLCSGCRVVYYCSENCRDKDWQVHKPLCKKVQKLEILLWNGRGSLQGIETRTFVPKELHSPYFEHHIFPKKCENKKGVQEALYPELNGKQDAPLQNEEIGAQFLIEVNGEKYFSFDRYQLFRDEFLQKGQDFHEFLKNVLQKWKHPYLYLELSAALFEKAYLQSKEALERMHTRHANAFLIIGKALAEADVQCVSNDPSCMENIQTIVKPYFSRQVSMNSKSDAKFLEMEIKKVIDKVDLFLSPRWVTYKGRTMSSGILPEIKSPEECFAIRKQKLNALLTNSETRKNSSIKTRK